MARNRMISSDFPDNQKLSQVGRDARLTFIEMWILADDFGVVIGHNVWLNSHCFPYDSIVQSVFDSWIEELLGIGVIAGFEKDGSFYYVIRDWDSHQKINRPSHEKRNPEAPKDIFTEDSLRAHGGLTEGSLTKEKEKIKEREEEIYIDQKNEKCQKMQKADFETFWKQYPRKVGRGAALRTFQRIDRALLEIILASLEQQKKMEQWQEPQFIPHPATWLNQERWCDEVIVSEKEKLFGGLSTHVRERVKTRIQEFKHNLNREPSPDEINNIIQKIINS